MQTLLQLADNDNVLTCTSMIKKGQSLDCAGFTITAVNDIPVFHKIAKSYIKAGSGVYKYGEVIGIASRDIHQGEHVHVHNVESARGRGDTGRN